jgi:isocitrate/isopropylmalate dehydrogenase
MRSCGGSGVNTSRLQARARFAFDYAENTAAKKVTIVHKANILKALTGVFWRLLAKWEDL